MNVSAGALRHTVSIVSPSTTQDSFGGITGAGTVLATVRAAVQPLTGRELVQAQQTVAEVSHKVTIRYLAGVQSKQTVTYFARAFVIEYIINPGEMNRELQLFCRELT